MFVSASSLLLALQLVLKTGGWSLGKSSSQGNLRSSYCCCECLSSSPCFAEKRIQLRTYGRSRSCVSFLSKNDEVAGIDESKRNFVETSCKFGLSTLFNTVFPKTVACAGELGAKINAAVTQSDLGISVRRSVVKGAQLMDKIDGQWERFSDDYGLGSERRKRDARPAPKKVPELLPLDDQVARALLNAADSVFLALVPMSSDKLKDRVVAVERLVRKSFERSNESLVQDSLETIAAAPQFNFLCYVHFRAFNDLLVENKINFGPFRNSFESKFGDRILDLFAPGGENEYEVGVDPAQKKQVTMLGEKLGQSLAVIDTMMERFRTTGLIAAYERSEIVEEKIDDWCDDLSDMQFSVSLDEDVTMNAQILLQEQGFRLYPNFPRFAIASELRRNLGHLNQRVTSEEYYMDTDYNSDPDKFEVKQVLLNIVLDSA